MTSPATTPSTTTSPSGIGSAVLHARAISTTARRRPRCRRRTLPPDPRRGRHEGAEGAAGRATPLATSRARSRMSEMGCRRRRGRSARRRARRSTRSAPRGAGCGSRSWLLLGLSGDRPRVDVARLRRGGRDRGDGQAAEQRPHRRVAAAAGRPDAAARSAAVRYRPMSHWRRPSSETHPVGPGRDGRGEPSVGRSRCGEVAGDDVDLVGIHRGSAATTAATGPPKGGSSRTQSTSSAASSIGATTTTRPSRRPARRRSPRRAASIPRPRTAASRRRPPATRDRRRAGSRRRSPQGATVTRASGSRSSSREGITASPSA